MDISFPINKLLNKGLTADDYTIATLLKEKKYGLLKEYIKLLKNKFYESLKRLKDGNYISYNAIGDVVPIKEIKVTDDFIDIITRGDNFEEFYQLYPTKVTRPEGEVDYLRKDKHKCKIKYKKIVGNNLFKHDHLMDCLRYEIEKRQKNNNMAYFQRMINYLNSENYKKYEEELHTVAEKEMLNINTANTYGTELL